MPKWWPFAKTQTNNDETAFTAAEMQLRQRFDTQIADGTSLQTILYTIEKESQQLEQVATTPEISAKLRAYDLLYSELRPRMMENLNSGRAHEMAGRIPDAIKSYENAVADQISIRFPYEHLRVIYRRQQQYANALRICQLAISNPYLSAKDHQHFQNWAEKLETAVSP
ncbi:MAG: hypothetical protein GY943_27170 [Chloroflexi bacterium]|nr:hypothetical protein [Chloroflexota bacterium]